MSNPRTAISWSTRRHSESNVPSAGKVSASWPPSVRCLIKPPDDFKPIGPEEHHRQVAGDAVEYREVRRQCTHIEALKPQPGKLFTLNGSSACDLRYAQINAQYLSCRAHLLSHIKSWDAMTGGDVEDSGTGKQLKMLEQRFSKRRGPIILLGEGPPGCHNRLSLKTGKELCLRLAALRRAVNTTISPCTPVGAGRDSSQSYVRINGASAT